VIWTFTRTADDWHFARVPERLLPGDSTEPIEKYSNAEKKAESCPWW